MPEKSVTTKLITIAVLLLLTGCCGGGNPDCVGFPAPWTWGNTDPPRDYNDAVKNLPKGTCNDTGEDWPGVPKCPKQ